MSSSAASASSARPVPSASPAFTPAGAVAALVAAVDQVLGLDVATMSGDEVDALVLAVQVERSRLGVAAAAPLAEWEASGRWGRDGSLRASGALARDTRSCPRVAARELARARRLVEMPHTRAAVVDRRLSMDHVDLFLKYATRPRWALFLEHEATLVEACSRVSSFEDARRLVRYWAQHADALLDHAHVPPEPSALFATRTDEGALLLRGELSAIDGEIVENELRRLEQAVRADDRAAGVTRTRAQRRAAALVRMATRSAGADGRLARPLFQVVVGDETARRLCELASGQVVHPADLVPFVDDAVMESFLFDGPSVVISKSHQRTFKGALRRAILVRDRRCTHPSVCDTPAAECDVDHIIPFARGGGTTQSNGRAECLPHNRLAHLHDEAEAPPERDVTFLDHLRAKARWYQAQCDREAG